MTLDQITELFKWMTIINAGILILTTFLVMGLKNVMAKINIKLARPISVHNIHLLPSVIATTPTICIAIRCPNSQPVISIKKALA